ncbi:interaptin-like [Argopecten irradians]|uniref:interaptin-like n=1 Tax=Argopecten irradians TaxID=31199 RepID=UPI00371DA598
MSAEMEMESSVHKVYNVTMVIRQEFSRKMNEAMQDFKKLEDVAKSHDQTKQELQKILCKACRRESYHIFKLPHKTFSDIGCQADHKSLQPRIINGDKHELKEDMDMGSREHQPREDDTSHQPDLTPTEHRTKLESIIQELQGKYQQEKRNVGKLQATLETVQNERDSYKRQSDKQQVEITRLRQQTNCFSDSQHAAKPQDTGVALQEEKFEELVQDIGTGKRGVSGSTEEVNRLKEDCETRNDLIKNLKVEKDKQVLKNTKLMEENQSLQQTIEELQTQLMNTNHGEKSLQGENHSLNDNQNKCNYNLRPRKEHEDKQTNNFERIRRDKEQLEQNVDQLNERVANLKAKLEKTMTENDKLVKDKSDLTKENERIRMQMNGAQQEKKQIQLNLQQLEVTLSQTKSKLEEKEKKNQKMIDTLTDRDAELESLSTEKSNFHSQMELAKNEKAQIQRELDDQQEQRQKETSNIRNTENEIRKLTRTCDEQKHKLQCAEQEKKQLESQSAVIVQKRDLIQHELDEVKKNLETSNSTIRGMQIENQRLIDILTSRDDELRSIKREKDNLTSHTEHDKQCIERELDEQKEKSSTFETELMKAKNNILNLTNNLSTSDERLRALQDNHQKLKAKMTTLQQEHDANKKTLDHKTLALKEMEKENARLKTAHGKCEEGLSTLQDNYHKLETKMKTLQEKHDQTKQTLEERTLANRKKEEEIASLKLEIASRDEELRSTKTERDTLNSQLTDAQHEKLNIQRDLEEQREKSAQTEKQLLKAKKDTEGCLTTRDEELRSTKSERDKLNSQLKDVQHEKLNIQRDLEEQKEKSAQTERQFLKAKKDIQTLTESLRINEERLQTLHDNHHKLKGAMATSQLEHDRTKQALDGTTLSNRKMEEENAQLKAERDKQREEIQQCNQQIEELKKPRKKRIVLGLRSERSGLGKSLVDMVTREMTTRLQKRLDVYNLNLVVSFSQISSEVTNGFQIALCLNMSRVGTNIVDSIKGMKVDRDLFVMVLHHTNKENLSSLTPTSHRVTGSEVRQLGGILDMAFSSDSGLYDCDLNNAAMEKIAVILKKCLIL